LRIENLRQPALPSAHVPGLSGRVAAQVFSHMPDRCLVMAGNILYRHIA